MPRKPFHYEPRPERIEAVEAAVKAAYLGLLAEGEFPCIEKVRKRARIANWIAAGVVAKLIAAGSIPPAASNYSKKDVDDPYTEKPDAPNAKEIEDRVAAIRAEKETEVRPVYVRTAKLHRRDRKRLVA